MGADSMVDFLIASVLRAVKRRTKTSGQHQPPMAPVSTSEAK